MKILSQFQKKFNKGVNLYLEEKEKQFQKIDHQATFLIKVIEEFINRGGKRLRPAIFYYAYKSFSQKNLSLIFKLSFVFELFHTFALIHDDIIDRSELRRNQPTIHKKHNLATAILVGDLALMLADEIFFEVIKDLKLNLEKQKEVFDLYNQFKQEVIIGEYLDDKKIGDVYKIMELKTAGYSFVKPALIGFSLANISQKQIKKWIKILKEIGVLFQVKDDFLGTFGKEKKIGKPVDSDVKEGKKTLIVEEFLKKASFKEKERFYRFFGKEKINKEDFLWYKKLLVKYKIFDELKGWTIKDLQKIKTKLYFYFPKQALTKLLFEILDKIGEF